MKNFLKTTEVWALLFCFLAAISPAFPWSFQVGYETAARTVDVLRIANPKQVFLPVSAYVDWHGAAISVTGGLGMLFLVATGSMRPIPLWRTLGIVVVGFAIIAITIIFSTRHWNHFPVDEFGGLLAIVSATALLFIACLEVRWLLTRQASSQGH